MAVDYNTLPTLDIVLINSTEEVQQLADGLEAVLDPRYHRLMHQLRLAAEQLGVVRGALQLQHPL